MVVNNVKQFVNKYCNKNVNEINLIKVISSFVGVVNCNGCNGSFFDTGMITSGNKTYCPDCYKQCKHCKLIKKTDDFNFVKIGDNNFYNYVCNICYYNCEYCDVNNLGFDFTRCSGCNKNYCPCCVNKQKILFCNDCETWFCCEKYMVNPEGISCFTCVDDVLYNKPNNKF